MESWQYVYQLDNSGLTIEEVAAKDCPEGAKIIDKHRP
jgi:hypothetical protein